METNTLNINRTTYQLGLKITIAIASFLMAQTVLLAISAKTIKTLPLSQIQLSFLESSVITLFVILCIWILRKTLDRGIQPSMGLNTIPMGLSRFVLGLGLLLAPLLISLFITHIAGWATIKINWQSARIDLILLGMISVLITDALPEELVYRGYVYGNLLKNMVKWKSALVTTLLFVLTPILLFPLKSLFGAGLTTGLVNNVSVSYLGYMLFFGAFAMYLRVLTKSIWTGVGFHLMFVYMNQLIGLEDINLIQFSSFSNEMPVQLTFIIFLLLTFIALFMYPKLKGVKLGWLGNKD